MVFRSNGLSAEKHTEGAAVIDLRSLAIKVDAGHTVFGQNSGLLGQTAAAVIAGNTATLIDSESMDFFDLIAEFFMFVRLRPPLVCLALLLATFYCNSRVAGQTVWSGLTTTFTRDGFVDGTAAANQDKLTNNVIFARLSNGGLVNFASEATYIGGVSPAGTEWATALNNPAASIAATNWANLSFTDWIDAFGGEFSSGGGIPNQPAVVHLITDNIYLDLEFTDWTPGHNAGYSYMRAAPSAAPNPTGDYNGNGVVDASDYVVWRNTLGQSISPAGSGADGNANGTIDSGDYAFWRGKFGNAAPGSGSGLADTQVPEPATVMLEVCGLAFALLTTRQRSTIAR
jgi:hypothetical protein